MNPNPPKTGEDDVATALTKAIQAGNYLLAEGLARRLGRPENEIRDLQEKALEQYVLEFRNPQGSAALAEAFGLSEEDVRRVLTRILREAQKVDQEDKGKTKKRFDVQAMDYLSLEEWIRKYFKI